MNKIFNEDVTVHGIMILSSKDLKSYFNKMLISTCKRNGTKIEIIRFLGNGNIKRYGFKKYMNKINNE